MIHPYNNANLTRWDNGELQVKIMVPTSERPVAYCDGTDADEDALRAIAESENTELPPINRRTLKTGRQIWTIDIPPEHPDADDWAN